MTSYSIVTCSNETSRSRNGEDDAMVKGRNYNQPRRNRIAIKLKTVMKPINLKEKHSLFTKHWHPHQIAIVDDMQVILAKIKDEFVWHSHANEDELFQVLKGTLYMKFRDRTEVVEEGEIIVVPKGIEHCPSTKKGEEVHLLLFEKLSTAHTGKVEHELTQRIYPKI